METCYAWEDAGAGHTRMALRNRGAPKGFSILLGPFLDAAMRAANKKDLLTLKTIFEH